MNTAETPQITGSFYTNSVGNLATWGSPLTNASSYFDVRQFQRLRNAEVQTQYNPTPEKEKSMADKTNRRIVQVFIADPNDNVPLDKSVLYTGEQKLTDLNDTELFFEVSMLQDLIKSHNDLRKVTVDKEASKRAGKDIFLDPVKIRDLKMVVVTIAQF
jgi:hypothetical protein